MAYHTWILWLAPHLRSTVFCLSHFHLNLFKPTPVLIFSTHEPAPRLSHGAYLRKPTDEWIKSLDGWAYCFVCRERSVYIYIYMTVIGIKSQQYQTLSLFESHAFQFIYIHSKHYFFHIICCLGLSRDTRCVAPNCLYFLKVQASSYTNYLPESSWS